MHWHVGVAGWSYDDWKDRVYPPRCTDTLAWCARFLPLLEINTTFYRTPARSMVSSWVQRTEAAGTRFVAKVGGEFTHERSFTAAAAEAARNALAPLPESGRLLALLAQFPFTLRANDAALRRIERTVHSFRRLAPIAVEVRHGSWADPRWSQRLAALGCVVVATDLPLAADGYAVDVPTGTGADGPAYLRLHGRHARAWFDARSHRDQKHDWLYAPAEVDEIWQRLLRLAANAQRTIAVANNHFQGKAVKLAVELLARTGDERPQVPALLLDTYPGLRQHADPWPQGPVQGTLF